MVKLRPLGSILLDLEPILEEMIDKHDLQKSDVIALVSGWIDAHRPDCREEYEDGTFPVLFYGPKESK
jgi:hypothetical protein